MKNSEIAVELVELVGGKDNILAVTNCMTRARFYLKDNDKMSSEIKKAEFVLGLVEGEQTQIILGPGKAQKVVDEMVEQFDLNRSSVKVDDVNQSADNNWEENKKKYKKESKTSAFLKKLGQVFVPMIPGFIASGLLLGFCNIVLNVSGLPEADLPAWYHLCKGLAMGLYGFLAIFTGINTAKVFGGTEILGGIIGALTISGTELTNFFLQLGMPLENAESMAGKGGIFGVLFAVMFMSYIEKKIRKKTPDSLDLIVTPLATLVITGVVTLFIFMPSAHALTMVINFILDFLLGFSGPLILLSGFLIAAFFLPLVTVGLHHGFTPIYIMQIQTYGYTTLFPIAAMGGAGQVGSSAAIYIQAKRKGDKRMQKIIAGAIIPGILGVGEPLIYGVTLPLGKPFITAGIGAGFGGAWIAWMGVGAVASGPSGVTAIPLIVPGMIWMYVVGLLISYVSGFIVTMLFYDYDPSKLDV